MPRINTYEPTELEALETAHEVILKEIEYVTGDFWIDQELQDGESDQDIAYRHRLINCEYWIRTRLDTLRQG